MSMRIALGIEYNGSAYSGWQFQSHVISVQHIVEQAISKVADEAIRVQAAGRTDTGVHATEQVVHFDTKNVRETRAWVLGVNTHLPDDISILWAKEMPDEFNARFSATSRRYRYIILNQPTRSALLNKLATIVHSVLNHEQMQQAANYLLGEHDFTSYRALACQAKSPVREIYSISIQRSNEILLIDIHANSFLHHMVRNIAGVLITIGKGEQETSWSRQILDLRDRTQGGVTAPAEGLYLVKVHYPDDFDLNPTINWPLLSLPDYKVHDNQN